MPEPCTTLDGEPTTVQPRRRYLRGARHASCTTWELDSFACCLAKWQILRQLCNGRNGSDRLKLNLAAGYLFRIRSVVQVDIPSHEGNLQESVCLGALVHRGVSLVLGGR